jgi:hypothetical protein
MPNYDTTLHPCLNVGDQEVLARILEVGTAPSWGERSELRSLEQMIQRTAQSPMPDQSGGSQIERVGGR